MSVQSLPTRWLLPPAPHPDELVDYRDVPPLIAALLHARAIPPGDVSAFLNDKTITLADPFLLSGMDTAVSRIRSAFAQNERICVYGDYDADGLTAQALLITALRWWGYTNLCMYTPHREREGYGLHHDALTKLADDGVRLVIAVDCGISNAVEIAQATERGVDVIVVDHHQIPRQLPDAAAVINPHLTGSAYPFHSLAGVGVAYALVRALSRSGQPFIKPTNEIVNALLTFVAVGTIADVVPLVGENRILVQAGLRALRKTTHPGLRALAERAGINLGTIDAGHISFALAPRLNAPGRVRGVEDAYRVLLPTSDVDARLAALALDEANHTRQDETLRALNEAIAMVEANTDHREDKLLFVGDKGWNIGIVGLVAAKLVDRYHRPAFVYARGATESRGSARSVAAFDVSEVLTRCDSLLARHGGHPKAAGFTVSNDNLNALQHALVNAAASLTDEDLAPTLRLDAVLPHEAISLWTAADVAALAPFGHGNPEPAFLIPNVRVGDTKRVGAEGAHLAFQVAVGGRDTVRCIAFDLGPRERELAQARHIDLAATLQRDVWQGDERLQLRVRDFRRTS